MTREEAIQVLKEISTTLKSWSGFSEYPQAIDMAIEALSAPSGDLISRADAMGAVQDHFNADGFKGYDDGQQMMDRINALPSAEPKTGEWIEVEVLPEVYDIEGVKSWGSKMQCDQCGFRFTAIEGHIRQYNFCPYCGSFNGGEEE